MPAAAGEYGILNYRDVARWSSGDFRKGQFVTIFSDPGRWYEVQRRSKHSLTLSTGGNVRELQVVRAASVRAREGAAPGTGWVMKVAYSQVNDRKTAAEITAMKASGELAADDLIRCEDPLAASPQAS